MKDRARSIATEPSLSTRLGAMQLENPVMPASGCFGPELSGLMPLARLAAVVTKTVFSGVRSGNPSHRLTETPDGMLNAVGIPSPGGDAFRQRVLPGYLAAGSPLILSVGGLTAQEYWNVVEETADIPYAALEVNVSCPNLERGGLEIGAEPDELEQVIRGVVARTDRPVIAKLTPNVTSVDQLALAAEAAGAAALTVANTYVGLAVDSRSRRPELGNVTGGLSGPAIKPLTLRLVWQIAQAVDIPIIGCGGIISASDVLEYLMVGASAVQVGTATFTRPDAMIRILNDLPEALRQIGASSVTELVGAMRTTRAADLARPDHH